MRLCCRYCGRALRHQPPGKITQEDAGRLIEAFSERCVCGFDTSLLIGLLEGRPEALAAYRDSLSDWYAQWGVVTDTVRKQIAEMRFPLASAFCEDARRELAHRKSLAPGRKQICAHGASGVARLREVEDEAAERAGKALDALFACHTFSPPEQTFLEEIERKVGPETALLLARGWAGEEY